MTTLRFISDGSGSGQGWQGASGCSSIVSLARDNDDDTDETVVLFTLALHLPEEIPVSSKITEWLGLLIGLWEVERWLDNVQQQQENGSSSLDEYAGSAALTRFFFQQQEDSLLPKSSRCLEIISDSQGLIKILHTGRELQVIHIWEQPAVQEVRRLVSKLTSRIQTAKLQTTFTWIAREQNEECDALSKRARKETATQNVSAATRQRAMSFIRDQVIPRRNEYMAMKEERRQKKRRRTQPAKTTTP